MVNGERISTKSAERTQTNFIHFVQKPENNARKTRYDAHFYFFLHLQSILVLRLRHQGLGARISLVST